MDLGQYFEGQTLDVECPNCHESISFDASLAFKSNSVIKCSNCSKEISLETAQAQKDAEKALNDLKDLFD